MGLAEKLLARFRKTNVREVKPPYEVERYEVVDHFGTEEEGDLLVLQQLRDSGADLTRERHVLHYLYFDELPDRDRAAEAVRRLGYETNFGNSTNGMRYLMTVERVGIVNEQMIFAERPVLAKIAEENHGAYDGWEAQQD